MTNNRKFLLTSFAGFGVLVFIFSSPVFTKAVDLDYKEELKQIDALIQKVNAIDLSVDFLSSPEYRSLVDISVILPRPSRIGRPNPFEALPETELVGDDFVLPIRTAEGLGEVSDADTSAFVIESPSVSNGDSDEDLLEELRNLGVEI